MPEIPEIYLLARQMDEALAGKVIAGIEVKQPKCLNLPEDEYIHNFTGARLGGSTCTGKWIRTETSRGWLLLCLGMGGEILLVSRTSLPPKYRLVFDFTDSTCLAVNFWWFGYAHFAAPDELSKHAMTATLGPNAIGLSSQDFGALLKGRRGQLKSFLLDQSNIAGIGNFYIHDILFLARLHPLRLVQSLSEREIRSLAEAIQARLQLSIDKGAAEFEQNLFGQKGGFGMKDLLVGYREGQPCPNCGAIIEKLKTGGTHSFICPNDQAFIK